MLVLKVCIAAAFMAMAAFVKSDDTNDLIDSTAIELRDGPPTSGVGWLLDFCDDDWNIFPKFWFYGKCGDAVDNREWHHIDLTNCYTVTPDGRLAGDNWRQ